jgi:cation diffusion facilitator CzcD-associated flavoprotein CzcO
MAEDHIVIVGAGFAGLGMAIRLKQAGIHDFTILEADDGVGGTWRANHYPGAACDVPSHLYSFSFEKNPTWSRSYGLQREILAYLERCADKYGLRPHLQLNTEVVSAKFDDHAGLWELRTNNGKTLRARVVISGCGGLSRPSYPAIPGLDRFRGKLMHSARWDDDYALEGKRVGVIGTGASAIQIVPAIAPKVSKLNLFQRTPPWILPKRDLPISTREQDRFRRFPVLQEAARLAIYWLNEAFATGFVKEPRILRFAQRFAEKHLAEKIRDPELRAKLTPTYAMGCKRILLSNDYYPALERENVAVVTEGIREITETGIVTNDGRSHDLDALLLCTGFQAAEQTAPFDVKGRAGIDLAESWRDGAEAYKGTTVAGFPNMFLIVGPNTGLGHTSMVFMIESQIAYVLDAIQLMRREKLASLEVKRERQDAFNVEMQERLARTIWQTGGCTSWYQTKSGKNVTLWPGYTVEFRLRLARFDRNAYTAVPQRSSTTVREAPSRAQSSIGA